MDKIQLQAAAALAIMSAAFEPRPTTTQWALLPGGNPWQSRYGYDYSRRRYVPRELRPRVRKESAKDRRRRLSKAARKQSVLSRRGQ